MAPPSSRLALSGGAERKAAIPAITIRAISAASAACSTLAAPREARRRVASGRIARGWRVKARAGGAPAYESRSRLARMEGGFGGLFGDPEELRRRMEEMQEQMAGAQKVAWADNAIKLAVEMTTAAISSMDLTGSADEQAQQVRNAMGVIFPEAVTLVREAREGLQ